MKKLAMATLLLAATAGTQSANGQENWCGSDHYLQQWLDASPENRAAFEAQENAISEWIDNNGHATRAGKKYIIPVVVHVLYNTCPNNISIEQIKDALRILNEDYSRTNPDSAQTRSTFKHLAADAEIEFRLARLDPNGNTTEGVTRKQTSAAIDAGNNVKSIVKWPTNKYLNIWVVESIAGGGGGGIILGYAQFPNSGGPQTYGIVIRNDAMGTIGTSNADGRTLTHEVGHCLNLFHTFQDGCEGSCASSGDRVCDTPPASDATYSCSFSINTCSNDASGSSSAFNSNVPDMIENYMSYNSCQNLFTKGQKTRMHAAIANMSILKDLCNDSNLITTGVLGVAVADFTTSPLIVSAGTTVTFSDASAYNPDSYDWTFGGNASPASSTNAQPSVIFPDAGLQSVTLTSRNNKGEASITKKVFVVSSEGQFIPHLDGIEKISDLPVSAWYAVNHDNDELEWKVTTEAASDGLHSLKMDNYGSCGQRKDDLISQSFDLSPFSSATLTFNVAFARRETSNKDFLRLYISNDFGQTWNYLWVAASSNLSTVGGLVTSPFVPTAQEWETKTVTLNNASYLSEGTIFKFEFIGDGGNNLYIDDFSLNGTYSGELLLRAPDNGKKGRPARVTIDWKSVGYVDSYEYQIDKSNTFDSQDLISGTTTYLGLSPHDTDTEYLTDSLDLSTTYYWRVRYVQNGTTSDWSETWSFTISDDGIGVGETVPANTIALFPNPATDEVTVSSRVEMIDITVYDPTGRPVLHRQPAAITDTLDTRPLAQGIYIVAITTASGHSEMKRLVVR